ncbi:MAG TPA: ankyrin repeat domain-containing protein [Candidatus Cloacimonadota bacterium]|nr:ankyrin repeat domain-containing protein [Candidatus Cloacimonadota bacterium]
MAKHRVFIVVTLLIILGCGLLSCSKAERSMRRDRHWAKEYLNSLGREHYNVVLCAAAQSMRITRIPSVKRRDYSFAEISNSRSVETIKLLSRMGLNLDYGCEGKTPLMLAAMASHYSIVQILLQLGANPLVRDEKGKTALDYAQPDSEVAAAIQQALDNIRSASVERPKPQKRKIEEYELIEESSVDSLADSLTVDKSYQKQAEQAELEQRAALP